MSVRLEELFNTVPVNSIHAVKGNGIEDTAGPVLVHAGPVTVRIQDAGLLATARKISEGRAKTAPTHKISVTSRGADGQIKTNLAAVLAEGRSLG